MTRIIMLLSPYPTPNRWYQELRSIIAIVRKQLNTNGLFVLATQNVRKGVVEDTFLTSLAWKLLAPQMEEVKDTFDWPLVRDCRHNL